MGDGLIIKYFTAFRALSPNINKLIISNLNKHYKYIHTRKIAYLSESMHRLPIRFINLCCWNTYFVLFFYKLKFKYIHKIVYHYYAYNFHQ